MKKKGNNSEPFFINDEISVISLGDRCFARSFFESSQIFNFKKREKRMPFDGCLTKYESTLSLIDKDFNNVFQGLRLNPKKDRRGRFSFLTDFQSHLHEQDASLKSFRNEMSMRINQFREELKSCSIHNKKIVFILMYDLLPSELIDLLKNKYPRLDFTIFNLATNFSDKKTESHQNKYYSFNHIPKPFKSYTFNNSKHKKSSAGQNYEKEIIHIFKNFITEIKN
tara:strand:+ start:762 stop:1436 length:675 start_codon:yes stop_codon:yes gene_type:complete